MGLLTLTDMGEELADAITGFALEVPRAVRDAARPGRCGPIAFGLALYLRANNLPGGLIHVTGMPANATTATGHYLTVSGAHVIDFTYRQFDPDAPTPVLYQRLDLTQPPARWRPWTGISGELEGDDPLYPDFVAYDGYNLEHVLDYVPARLADPQWVTPFDDR